MQPPDEEGLFRAVAILGEIARVVHPIEGTFDLSGCGSLVDAVIGIITRHPMREDELLRTLAYWSPDQVKTAHFPDQSKSRRSAPDYVRKKKSESIEN